MSETFLADDSQAPAANPEAAARPSDDGSQAATAELPAGAAGSPWGEISDDLKGLAEVKGWQNPADALKSYQQLESYLGADKAGRGVVLPKDEDDQEALAAIYDRLGRPEKAEDYGLAELLKDGEVDENFMGAMAQSMHESGLSKKQAQKMAESYQAQWVAARDAQAARHEAEVAEARRELSPREQEEARRGFRFLELEPQDAAAVEYYLGVKKAAQVLGKIGRALGEDGTVEGARGASGSSPEGAKRRMDERMADPLFSQRYLSGDQAAINEMEELAKAATARA